MPWNIVDEDGDEVLDAEEVRALLLYQMTGDHRHLDEVGMERVFDTANITELDVITLPDPRAK